MILCEFLYLEERAWDQGLEATPPFHHLWLWSHSSTIEKNYIIFNHVHATHIGMPNRKWMNK